MTREELEKLVRDAQGDRVSIEYSADQIMQIVDEYTSEMQKRIEELGKEVKRFDGERLRSLVNQLPDNLRSDWNGTNHYELQTPRAGEYWWLTLGEIDYRSNLCVTEDGKRLGLLLDIAEELSRLK